ncbi:MAG TPA: tetratricopeptide repeat protein [Ramlibacter sp.]|nr:tetratricopeptide repeat protein [Ramlibacter sp.]
MLDWLKLRKRETSENWKEKGNSHLAEGRTEEALSCYLQAVKEDERDPLAHLNAGFACQELGRDAEAVAAFKRSLALDAGSVDAHYLLGKSLAAQGALEEAAARFETAIELRPGFAYAHRDLGVLEERMGHVDNALHCYERAVTCDPEFAADLAGPMQVLRARALHASGQHDGALVLLGDLLQAHPQDVAALQARGNLLFDLKRYDQALEDCERVVALRPDLVEGLSSCGAILERLGRYQEALDVIDKALQMRPDFAAAANNQGLCLLALGRCREAIAASERALQANPAEANLHWNKGVGHLLLGELREGWSEHEWRSGADAMGQGSRPAVFNCPMWTGTEPLAGKTIVLTAEQGLGDSIQFLRYAPLLAQQGAAVLLRLPQPLVSIANDLAPGCRLALVGEADRADYFCPLLSLPFAFRTTIETIPASVPYLRSEAQRKAAWEEQLGPRSKTRVGLVWSGNPAHRNDANRSIALAALLAAVPSHCQLVNLQKDIRPQDQDALAASGMFDPSGQLQDFADTAALVDCMDLVISVDTSVAHLAGALARPLWLLLPFAPDWRWILGRDDTPWYPTARLFRQGEDRRWEPVLARVAKELAQLA